MNVAARLPQLGLPRPVPDLLEPTHIAETALYVDDLGRAEDFYTRLFGSARLMGDDRFRALRISDDQVLLLFLRGVSLQAVQLSGGTVPPHDGAGPLHVCFGIRADALGAWQARLASQGIPVESRVHWPTGATSLYFRDPDGHALELATPGIWRKP